MDERSVRREALVGFGRSAAAYERGRPGYPADAVALLARALELRPGRRLVDVGAGTGKLTRALVGTGADVVAVEPVAQMRRRFAEVLPGVEVRDGTAGQLPLGDGEVDAVAVGQAFHWFAGHAALAEFARVLRPGGHLGLIWNARDGSVPWVARLTEIVNTRQGDTPRHASGAWRLAFAAGQPWFGELGSASVRHVQVLDLSASLDRYASTSFIAALPDGERAALLVQVAAVLVEAAEPDGTVAHPYRTDVWWTPVSDPGAGRSRREGHAPGAGSW